MAPFHGLAARAPSVLSVPKGIPVIQAHKAQSDRKVSLGPLVLKATLETKAPLDLSAPRAIPAIKDLRVKPDRKASLVPQAPKATQVTRAL